MGYKMNGMSFGNSPIKKHTQEHADEHAKKKDKIWFSRSESFRELNKEKYQKNLRIREINRRKRLKDYTPVPKDFGKPKNE